ncbi:MAG: hypothetical protein ACYC3X_21500 [Pirellulaceae bacterium]
MHLTSTVILACGAFLLCRVELATAQSYMAQPYTAPTYTAPTYDSVQPIVLTGASCCQSPATFAAQPVVRYQSSESYMSPSVSESIPATWTESEMMPLPAGPARHVTARTTVPFVEYRTYAPVVAPTESVQTFRPVVALAVPAGYVVGQGFIGQPKLYKPGQPVRNFLRYISP